MWMQHCAVLEGFVLHNTLHQFTRCSFFDSWIKSTLVLSISRKWHHVPGLTATRVAGFAKNPVLYRDELRSRREKVRLVLDRQHQGQPGGLITAKGWQVPWGRRWWGHKTTVQHQKQEPPKRSSSSLLPCTHLQWLHLKKKKKKENNS